MPEYPSQQHKTGTGQRAPVSFRDAVSFYADAAPGGQANPSYTQLLADSVRAEVQQVSGGEYVRGRQVEGVVTFVVTTRHLPSVALNSRIRVAVVAGAFASMDLYTHRVYVEKHRSRPRFYQLHCKAEL